MEKVKDMLKELEIKSFHAHSDSFSKDQLIQMLEESGIYIHLFIVNKPYGEIDINSCGGISKEEFGRYLETPRRRLPT